MNIKQIVKNSFILSALMLVGCGKKDAHKDGHVFEVDKTTGSEPGIDVKANAKDGLKVEVTTAENKGPIDKLADKLAAAVS